MKGDQQRKDTLNNGLGHREYILRCSPQASRCAFTSLLSSFAIKKIEADPTFLHY